MKTIKELEESIKRINDGTKGYSFRTTQRDTLKDVIELIDEIRTGCSCGRCTAVLKELKKRIVGK